MSGWEEAKKSRKVSDISSKWPQSYDEDDGGNKKSKLTFRQTVIFNIMNLYFKVKRHMYRFLDMN